MTLRDWLDRRTGIDLDLALQVFSKLILAVRQLHRSRMVHLDIKPANIFVATSDNMVKQVKLGDFGLALELKALASGGFAHGTPGYQAPEAKADAPRPAKVDPRAPVGSPAPRGLNRHLCDKADVFSCAIV